MTNDVAYIIENGVPQTPTEKFTTPDGKLEVLVFKDVPTNDNVIVENAEAFVEVPAEVLLTKHYFVTMLDFCLSHNLKWDICNVYM